MNSPETSPVNWISRRNILKIFSLSVLIPSVSSAVESVTARSSSNLPLKNNTWTTTKTSGVPKMKKVRPEEEYDNELTQEEVSHAWKMTLIIWALLGLDSDIRQHICSEMNSFFQEYLIDKESPTYADTALWGVKLVACSHLLRVALSFFSFQEGNASFREVRDYEGAHWVGHSFLSDIFSVSIVAPLIEESFYRIFIPKILAFFSSNPDFAQYYSSLIFGFVHNITFKGFDVSTIPASQILIGFFFFYLQQTRDVTHSMTAHATYNGTIISLYHLFSTLSVKS